MRKPAILLSLGVLLAVAAPLSGQEGASAGANPTLVEHAQLGVLEAVGVGNNRIIIALPGRMAPDMTDRPYESYDTNEETLVQGLGSIMRVSASLAPYVGNVVVVRYVDRGEHFVAKRIDFTSGRVVHETQGAIRTVDQHEHAIVLRNAQGRDETVHLGTGPGAVIDSDSGLRPFSDLRPGQQVTVLYGPAGRAQLLRIE